MLSCCLNGKWYGHDILQFESRMGMNMISWFEWEMGMTMMSCSLNGEWEYDTMWFVW